MIIRACDMEVRKIGEKKYGGCCVDGIIFSHNLDTPPFEAQSLHTHEMCEIHCVLRGSGSYVIEGVEHKIDNGKVFLMRSGEFHKRGCEQNKPYESLSIHFSPSLIDCFDPERRLLDMFFKRPLGKNNVYSRKALAGIGIYEIFRKMDEYSGNDYIGEVNMKTLLFSALFELSQLYSSSLFDENLDKNSNMQKIIEYINANLTEDLSVGHLCDKFFVSRAQINRKFKALTGSSVWEYIVTKRLLLAKEYISNGMGVVQAAETCGFGDYSTFYRAYTKKYEISPSKSKEN